MRPRDHSAQEKLLFNITTTELSSTKWREFVGSVDELLLRTRKHQDGQNSIEIIPYHRTPRAESNWLDRGENVISCVMKPTKNAPNLVTTVTKQRYMKIKAIESQTTTRKNAEHTK